RPARRVTSRPRPRTCAAALELGSPRTEPQAHADVAPRRRRAPGAGAPVPLRLLDGTRPPGLQESRRATRRPPRTRGVPEGVSVLPTRVRFVPRPTVAWPDAAPTVSSSDVPLLLRAAVRLTRVHQSSDSLGISRPRRGRGRLRRTADPRD